MRNGLQKAPDSQLGTIVQNKDNGADTPHRRASAASSFRFGASYPFSISATSGAK